jgi:hypothetical protein
MADDNRPLKYARYALGEILLVVVGILIALQINNWNEDRKSHEFEDEILSLIDQNLINDSISLSSQLIQAKRAMTLTDRLLDEVSQKKYGDSLNYWMGKIIVFERFKSQSSAFEVLKSKGIESISSKELQMGLISYYEQTLFNTYQSLQDVEESFKADWVPLIKEEFLEFNWMDYNLPNNSKEFFENPSSIVLFKIYKNNRAGSVNTLQKSLDEISELRVLIRDYENN